MHEWVRNLLAILIRAAITRGLSLVPYPVHPEWLGYGFPLPWYFVYRGPEMIFLAYTVYSLLISDFLFSVGMPLRRRLMTWDYSKLISSNLG